MTPILRQFLSESRDVLQATSEKLIRLEAAPDDAALIGDLFRGVHTLKGNCGLFDFPEMTRVLHAAEDLMMVVRDGGLGYTRSLADRLFDAMDFAGMQLDEIEATGHTGAGHAAGAVKLADALRELIPDPAAAGAAPRAAGSAASPPLAEVPMALRRTWLARDPAEAPLSWILYTPEPDCFFKGEDPFDRARRTPHVEWRRVTAAAPWPPLSEFDTYRCRLEFEFVSSAAPSALQEHFRYVPDQVTTTSILRAALADSLGEGGTTLFVPPAPAASLGEGGTTLIVPPAPAASLGQNGTTFTLPRAPAANVATAAAGATIIGMQLTVLGLPDGVPWLPGRLKGVAATLAACYRGTGRTDWLPGLHEALAAALAASGAAPLRDWLSRRTPGGAYADSQPSTPAPLPAAANSPAAPDSAAAPAPAARPDGDRGSGRRGHDAPAGSKTLKVDQEKVDRLMNLIGEMVVAKNGLPYLAVRAEAVFGARELAREIKTQYAVINRIADEMQDAILQVRMMPVSFVFQRLPRLVRDISRKLGKTVLLVLEGEDTEADKNIIEALGDPLIHIVRNSVDHGIELPEARLAAGKPAAGRVAIRASQEGDRVVIEISDDGKGIDPAVIKRKAHERGIIDETALARISDQDAVNLVFAAGLSTADAVSDLSGRGVGMDVVRASVEQVGGTVTLDSTPAFGTRLCLSLPLSMAVTNVMIIESDHQVFGVPMDMVVETVRVRRADIHMIKNRQTTVLRGRIVPLRALNELLADDTPQLPNAEDELATLVIRMRGEQVGIVVDDFREVVDIILKPMTGVLAGLPGYAGSALLGDGSVLMVLNPKELV